MASPLVFNPSTKGFPWDDLNKIFCRSKWMAKVPYSIETLAKILTGCVGRVNVTDDRPTQRVRLH